MVEKISKFLLPETSQPSKIDHTAFQNKHLAKLLFDEQSLKQNACKLQI